MDSSANDLAMDVGDAMADYITAKKACDEARRATDHGWGYYGQVFRDEVEARAEGLAQALDAFHNRKEQS